MANRHDGPSLAQARRLAGRDDRSERYHINHNRARLPPSPFSSQSLAWRREHALRARQLPPFPDTRPGPVAPSGGSGPGRAGGSPEGTTTSRISTQAPAVTTVNVIAVVDDAGRTLGLQTGTSSRTFAVPVASSSSLVSERPQPPASTSAPAPPATQAPTAAAPTTAPVVAPVFSSVAAVIPEATSQDPAPNPVATLAQTVASVIPELITPPDSTSLPALTDIPDAIPTDLSTLLPAESLPLLPSATSSDDFPLLPGATNSSSSVPPEPTVTPGSLFSNGTGLFRNSTARISSSGYFNLSATSTGSLTESSTETSLATLLPGGGGNSFGGPGSANGAGGPGGGPGSTDSGSSGGIPGLTPEQTTLVGGIVGGLAGVALVLVMILFALRWHKRRGKNGMFLNPAPDANGSGRLLNAPGSDSGAGAAGAASRSLGGTTGGLGMVQTNKASFLFPSAFAAAIGATKRQPSGRRRISVSGESQTNTVVSEGNTTAPSERSFYRVSGRKLPPVLTHGGDGYDPPDSPLPPLPPQPPFGAGDSQRASVASSTGSGPWLGVGGAAGRASVRDSHDIMSGTHTVLSLGSPMRPVSGVVVFKDGPARTPVQKHSPMSAGFGPGPDEKEEEENGREGPPEDPFADGIGGRRYDADEQVGVLGSRVGVLTRGASRSGNVARGVVVRNGPGRELTARSAVAEQARLSEGRM